MNNKEIENVIAFVPLKRYHYFIKKIADWEVFFTLVDENGEYVLSELEGEKLLPFWSAIEFAELCKISVWRNYTIKELCLSDLENGIIDFIVSSNCLINVFPVFDRTGFVVSLQEFMRDLRIELENY